MVFNIFKNKKKTNYDPLNIQVTDIKKGFVFEYDLKEWHVVAEYTYDWGNNEFSKEFKISSGDDMKFLSVEEDDEVEVILFEKIRLNKIEENILDEIARNHKPPDEITYQQQKYFFESESPGYFKEEGTQKEWLELMSWDYYNDPGDTVITIEQWGEREFEASVGKLLKPFEISNIIPAEQ
jgi:hypothetical protein